jgi:hypothetical protein
MGENNFEIIMDKNIFDNVNPNKTFVEEILAFDVNQLEATDGADISKFCSALGQYLIYMKYQMNKTKVEIVRRKRKIDGIIANLLSPELIKKYGTKTNVVAYLMSTVEELIRLRKEIEPLDDELMLLEGLDKGISELIAVFKRELTRRDNELYQIRQERK